MIMFDSIGRVLARYLSEPRERGAHIATAPPRLLAAALKKGDVLLIEGNSRISVAIKYLTQSSWSHAVLYVGNALGQPALGEEPNVLIEADVNEGIRAIPLSTYNKLHTRICRPVGLSEAEIEKVVAHAVMRVGQQYDLKNIIDLARYTIQLPPVPTRWRRRMLALGSGDPTRAICSSMIAEAFHSVHYPILPQVFIEKSNDPASGDSYREIMHIRHHSLFVPRDFDVSPYFQVIKPSIEQGFDPHILVWATEEQIENGKENV
ncbi:MAG: lipo-like protein [Chlorobiales bacterium]|nr:lipo-like protein [Chlorobiales bacterium]